jgi:hypothetical protein
MRRRTFTTRQIFRILNEYRTGTLSPEEVCAKHSIELERLWRWAYRFQHWSWAEILVLRALRRENARLRRTIAEMQRPSLN